MSASSEVAALFLFAFESLKEGLEVALAEAERAVPLNEFEEYRGAVTDGLGEDLEQVAVFVAVDEDAALLQLLDRHPDVADAFAQRGIFVVAVRRGEELDTLGAQPVDRHEEVIRGEREVLRSGCPIELQVFVDLGFLLARCRLVERKLHPVVAAGDDLAPVSYTHLTLPTILRV